jgi:hypothetical protein
MLVATGTLTVDMTKSKVMALPKFVSDSDMPTAFNDGGWGGPSRSYVAAAKKVKKESLDEIIKGAKAFLKTARQSSTKVPINANIPIINDHRANLVDGSSSEENNDDDCMFGTQNSNII